VSEGKPVTKSILERNNDASVVARYLKGRAQGRSRKSLKNELGIKKSDSTLTSME